MSGIGTALLVFGLIFGSLIGCIICFAAISSFLESYRRRQFGGDEGGEVQTEARKPSRMASVYHAFNRASSIYQPFTDDAPNDVPMQNTQPVVRQPPPPPTASYTQQFQVQPPTRYAAQQPQYNTPQGYQQQPYNQNYR